MSGIDQSAIILGLSNNGKDIDTDNDNDMFILPILKSSRTLSSPGSFAHLEKTVPLEQLFSAGTVLPLRGTWQRMEIFVVVTRKRVGAAGI